MLTTKYNLLVTELIHKYRNGKKIWRAVAPLLGLTALLSINFYGLLIDIPKELRSLVDTSFLWPHLFELSIYFAVSIALARFSGVYLLPILLYSGEILLEELKRRELQQFIQPFRRLVVVAVWRRQKIEPFFFGLSAFLVFTFTYFDTPIGLFYLFFITSAGLVTTFIVFVSLPQLAVHIFSLEFKRLGKELEKMDITDSFRLLFIFFTLFFAVISFEAGRLRMTMNFRNLVYFDGATLDRMQGHLLGSSSNGIFFAEKTQPTRFSFKGEVSVHFISFDGGSSVSVLKDFN